MQKSLHFLRVLLLSVTVIVNASLSFGQGIVADFPFNGNANDETGNGNNGTVSGATLTTDRFGSQNSAFFFDGNNDDIVIAATSNLQNFTAGSHSYSLWLTLESNPNVPKFVIDAAGTGAGGNQRGIRFESTKKPTYKWITTASSYLATSPTSITSNGDWYHIVGVFDVSTSSGKIYVNGIEKASTSSSGTPTPFEVMKIGNISSGGTGNGYFHGKIDDVKLFDKALTYQEIQDLFNTNGCNPVAYFPFNGSAVDETGNGNNGTVSGALLTSDRFDNTNSAYYFDGNNDEIVIAATSNLQNFTAGSHSYSLWLTLESNPNVPKFVIDAAGTGAGGNQRGIRFESTKKPTYKWVTTASSYLATSPTSITSNGDWYHIVGVFNVSTSTGKIYVNGIEKASTSSSGTPTPFEVMKIGNISSGGTGNGYFHGKIDDVRLYDCALTQSEIDSLYNELPTSIPDNQGYGLISIYPNPTSSYLNLTSNVKTTETIEIYDLRGSLVYLNKFSSLINVSRLDNGFYILMVKDKYSGIIHKEKIVIN